VLGNTFEAYSYIDQMFQKLEYTKCFKMVSHIQNTYTKINTENGEKMRVVETQPAKVLWQ